MVKGVNKTVIEINCTDNGYFERAILFISPQQSHVSQKRLHNEAEKYVRLLGEGTADNIPERPRKANLQGYKTKILMMAAALLVAAGVLFVIFNSL